MNLTLPLRVRFSDDLLSRDVDGNASLDTVYVANAFLSVDEATPMDLGEGGEGHHGVTDPTEGPMSPELAATEGLAAATAWGNYYEAAALLYLK